MRTLVEFFKSLRKKSLCLKYICKLFVCTENTSLIELSFGFSISLSLSLVFFLRVHCSLLTVDEIDDRPQI
jgi:hypothetical protein